MIILIPIGGKGSRFQKKNYKLPKALIKVNNKPMIFYLLDNICIKKIDYIYIPYNKIYKNYNFENILKNNYPHINFKFFY